MHTFSTVLALKGITKSLKMQFLFTLNQLLTVLSQTHYRNSKCLW